MSYQFYKLLHFIGLFSVFASLGAYLLQAMNSGQKDHPSKKWLGMWHGLGLVVVLVAGFGLLAKGKFGFQPWVIGKLLIWLVLGGSSALIMRQAKLAKFIWVVVIALGGLAAYLAGYKP